MHMDVLLTPDQLAKSLESVNPAALSLFSKQLDGRGRSDFRGLFPNIAAVRLSTEPIITNFVLLRARLLHHADSVQQFLAESIQNERCKHTASASVQNLTSDASLLDVMYAGRDSR